jgi:hypothetical protein
MKNPIVSHLFGRFFLGAFALLSLAVTPTLRADKGDSDQLELKATLLPTADAPAGASGKAELKAADRNGTTKAVLKIETKGLLPATYTINILTKSETTTITLGTLVVTGTAAVTGTDSSSENETDVNDSGENDTEQGVIFGGKGQPFPDGFNPFDIAAISVVDANSVGILNGDLSSGQTMLKAVQAIVPGIAAPNAKGKLTITAKSMKGVEKSVIMLFATKVPANLAFVINVDGTDLGQGTSTKQGTIHLGQTPGKHKGFAGFGQDISGLDLQSVTLTTLAGDEILSVTR